MGSSMSQTPPFSHKSQENTGVPESVGSKWALRLLEGKSWHVNPEASRGPPSCWKVTRPLSQPHSTDPGRFTAADEAVGMKTDKIHQNVPQGYFGVGEGL